MTDQATAVTITIDTASLNGYTDTYLATLWHVAQANPAPHGDRDAGKLAEAIGYEIIQRFLRTTAPELYSHASATHYWKALSQHCVWDGSEWVRKEENPTLSEAFERGRAYYSSEEFRTSPDRYPDFSAFQKEPTAPTPCQECAAFVAPVDQCHQPNPLPSVRQKNS